MTVPNPEVKGGNEVNEQKTPTPGAGEGAAKGAGNSDANPKRLLTFEDIEEGRIKPLGAEPDDTDTAKTDKSDGGEKDKTAKDGDKKSEAKPDSDEDEGDNEDVIDHFYEKDGEEYKKITVDDALENLQVTLKVNGKSQTLDGWDEVKKWASIGLASEEKRRKANEVFEENRVLKATLKAEAEKIAQERVEQYINDVLGGKKKAAADDEDADDDAPGKRSASTTDPVMRHLLAEVKRMRDEREAEKREREEAERTAAEKSATERNVKAAQDMADRVGDSFKDRFTFDGKLDEEAFNQFASYVSGATQAAMSRELDGTEDFSEILAKGEKVMRKMAKRYFDNLEAHAERLAQAKLKAKKGEPSKAASDDDMPEPTKGAKKKLLDWDSVESK